MEEGELKQGQLVGEYLGYPGVPDGGGAFHTWQVSDAVIASVSNHTRIMGVLGGK